MFTIANSTQSVANTPKQLSDIRAKLTASMLAQNPGIKLIEAQVKRDDARLSTYGKLALALDGFRSVASSVTATTGGSKSATPASTNDPATDVKRFVAAFNTLGKSFDDLRNGDAKSDATALKMKSQLGAILDSAGATQLAAIGITRKNGALTFDENKFKTALSAQPGLVTQVLGEGGLAGRMAGQVDRQIGTGGILAGEASGVTRERDKALAQKARVVESVNRQATQMAQQYQLAGSLMFGNTSTGRTRSPYDYSA